MCAAVQGRVADARAAYDRAGEIPPEDVLLAAAVEIDRMREDGAPFAKREARFGRALYKAHVVGALQGAAASSDCGALVDGYVRDAVLECQLDRALMVYQTVRDSSLADPLYRARIANRIGYGLCERGDPVGALGAVREAHGCARQLGSPQLLVGIESLWAIVDIRYGELADAEAHLREAQSMPLPAGEPSSEVGFEFARSGLLAARGRLGDARDSLEAVCARGLAVMGEVRSALYSELAIIAAEVGDFARAQSAARETRLGSRAHRFDVAYVGAQTALAQAELGMGRPARAHRRGQLARALALRSGLGYRRMVADLVVIDAAIALDRLDEARQLAEHTIERSRACGARSLEATAQLLSATAALRRQAPEAALEAAGEALRLARAGGHALLAARAHLLLGWSAMLRERDPEASEQLAAVAGAQAASGSPSFEAEVELLRAALRARTGNAAARRSLEQRLATATSRLSPVAWLQLRRKATDPKLAAVTRSGKQSLVRRGPAPQAHDLWVDASTGRVRIDGSAEIDLTSRPVLLKLLCVVLADPSTRFDKARLLLEVWQLPHRPAREPMLQKAVQRIGKLLSPDHPQRFFAWDADGKLELRAQHPCLVVPEPSASLNDRQRWLVAELTRRATISSGEYHSALSIARVTAYRDLEELVELGLIRRRGKGRAVVYERRA
jgi:tetratricopeptide (TPR) repeat protein